MLRNALYLTILIGFALTNGLATGCAQGGNSTECGNGLLEDGETCDGSQLGGATCASEGLSPGVLKCTPSCTLDTAGCGACTDQCATGASRCTGAVIEGCELGTDGCLAWVTKENCGDSGLQCDDSVGTAMCISTCTNACTAGESRCAGEIRQTCETAASGCLAWADDVDCTSSGNVCLEGPSGAECRADCTNPCSSGETRCDDNTIQGCAQDGFGCWDWQDGQDCAATSLVCDASSGTATCGAGCSDNCPSNGVVQCAVNVAQTCQTAASGCLDWADTEDCDLTGKQCQAGACACVNPCSTGQTQCNGSWTQDCVLNAHGCYEWNDLTDCSSLGQTCSGGSCQAVGTGYTQSLFSGTFTSIATSGTDATGGSTYTDDGYWEITLPFNFVFYGSAYTTVWMCSNGWLSFGADPGTTSLSNGSLPNTTAPNQAAYPFWDDLVYSQSTHADAALVYQTSGSAPNRVFTVEWFHVRYIATGAEHQASFQVKLYESTNVLEFVYDHATWQGTNYSATIGIEDDAQTEAIELGTAYVTPPNQDVRFTPN